MSAKPFVLAGEAVIAAVALGFSVKFYADKQEFHAQKNRKLGELEGRSCSEWSSDPACANLRTVTDNEKRYGEYALYCAIGGAAAVAILATTWLAWDDSPRVVVAYESVPGGGAFTLAGTF